MDQSFLFITFETTHKAIRFENLLIESYDIELIPTPREVTASCGLALKFKEEEKEGVLERLMTEDLSDVKLYYYHKHYDKTQAVAMDWREGYAAQN